MPTYGGCLLPGFQTSPSADGEDDSQALVIAFKHLRGTGVPGPSIPLHLPFHILPQSLSREEVSQKYCMVSDH